MLPQHTRIAARVVHRGAPHRGRSRQPLAGRCHTALVESPRFLQLADVAEILNISAAQAYALVRSGELPAIKVGGRGQWRVEREQLEAYIQRAYAETRAFVEAHPFGRGDEPPVD